MSRITGVLAVLALATTVLPTATTAAAQSPDTSHARAAADLGVGVEDLPRTIPRGVELRLADGDLLRVQVAADQRGVRATRYDAATASWGAPSVVLQRRNLICGQVSGRTSGGAVALVAECGRSGYSEDEAPTASQALFSPDGVTWTSYPLRGEAYEEPGISPGGGRAVYPDGEGYLTHGPEGWAPHALETPGREYTATAVITDDAQVSYLYGSGLADTCRIVVLTRTGDADPGRQELAPDDACSDTDLVNVDAHTALLGWLGDPGQVAVLSRPDAASPWAVTRRAPQDAPGLVVPDRGGLGRQFLTAPGAPLVALGSAGSRRVRAQVYDPVGQAWGPATTVFTSRSRCHWAGSYDGTLGVLVAELDCDGGDVALTTRDGREWQALRMGDRPLGQSPDGRYVAVPGPTSTSVISRELGVVTLPTGSTGRCDVALPDGPLSAVRLVAEPGSRRWPTLLRHVTADGATRIGRAATPASGRCAAAEGERLYDKPFWFSLRSTRIDMGQVVRLVHGRDGWRVRVKAF